MCMFTFGAAAVIIVVVGVLVVAVILLDVLDDGSVVLLQRPSLCFHNVETNNGISK